MNIKELEKENEILKSMLKSYAEEALEDISGWGAYASDYFQGKWGFQEDLDKWKHRIELSTEQKIKNVLEALNSNFKSEMISFLQEKQAVSMDNNKLIIQSWIDEIESK